MYHKDQGRVLHEVYVKRSSTDFQEKQESGKNRGKNID